MFGTLRYDFNNDRTEFLDRSSSFRVNEQSGHSGQHAACDLCRAKKVVVDVISCKRFETLILVNTMQLRCSGQKRGCDRCKASSSTCVYSTSKDDGRLKRRRRTDTGNTSKNNHEQDTGSTSSVQGSRPASALRGDVSEPERKSTDDTTLFPQPEQELQRSMEAFGQSDDVITKTGLPPRQDSLMQELDSDFGLPDTSMFDAIPSFNMYTPKSIDESSGNAAKIGMDHDLGFAPQTAQSSMATTRNWHVSPPPSAQLGNTQLSRDMSRDDSDWFINSPSSDPEPSAAEKALQSTNRQTSSKPSVMPACMCLVTKVSLLEELGSQKVDSSLNDALAVHKECLMKCCSVLDCQVCMSKSESVMLLVMVYEKMVEFCEAVTDAYLNSYTHMRSGVITPGPERLRLAVGKYSIDKDEEWDSLMGALTLYQVKVLGRQLLAIRKPASILLRGGQISKLLACERKMRALAERLRSY